MCGTFHLALLLNAIFLSISLAGDSFWSSIKGLADAAESQARTHFFHTGELPFERHPTQISAVSEEVRPEKKRRLLPSTPPTRLQNPTHTSINAEPLLSSDTSRRAQPPPSDDYLPTSNPFRTLSSRASHDGTERVMGNFKTPPALSLEDRKNILKEVGDRYTKGGANPLKSVIHPYLGQELTYGLIYEAFGLPKTQIRRFRQDIFVIPSKATASEPVFSIVDGRMKFTRHRKHHLYVWKRFALENQPGSIFQLVGVVETGNGVKSVVSDLPGYHSGRNLRPIGPDLLLDESLLTLQNNQDFDVEQL